MGWKATLSKAIQYIKTTMIVCFIFILGVVCLGLFLHYSRPTLPLGTWQSEESNMTLFIDRERSIDIWHDDWGGTFPGIYIQDGIETDITIMIEVKGGHVSIYETVKLEDGLIEKNLIIRDSYNIENDRLYISAAIYNPETNEFETIVFELIED